jgi:hypothetical protein
MDTRLNETLEDITPEDSACPVYRSPIPEEMRVEMDRLNSEAERLKAEENSRELAKQSALAKLAKLGLTEEEAKAVLGL